MNKNQTRPMADIATLGFRTRTAKAEAPADNGLASQVYAFAKRQRLSADAMKLFGTVAAHYEATGKAIDADGFELARLSDLPYEAVQGARQELAGWGHIVVRSDNAMGLDGLYPGPAWRDRNGR